MYSFEVSPVSSVFLEYFSQLQQGEPYKGYTKRNSIKPTAKQPLTSQLFDINSSFQNYPTDARGYRVKKKKKQNTLPKINKIKHKKKKFYMYSEEHKYQSNKESQRTIYIVHLNIEGLV